MQVHELDHKIREVMHLSEKVKEINNSILLDPTYGHTQDTQTQQKKKNTHKNTQTNTSSESDDAEHEQRENAGWRYDEPRGCNNRLSSCFFYHSRADTYIHTTTYKRQINLAKALEASVTDYM